jgi:hypothetical protein
MLQPSDVTRNPVLKATSAMKTWFAESSLLQVKTRIKTSSAYTMLANGNG